jgi:hypothetical protein
MKPYKHEVVKCRIGDVIFTEKAPDMPFEILSYSFTPEGILKIQGFGIERQSDVKIEYDSLEIGYRSLTDANYDTSKAVREGEVQGSRRGDENAPNISRNEKSVDKKQWRILREEVCDQA